MNLCDLKGSDKIVYNTLQKRGPLIKKDLVEKSGVGSSNCNRIIRMLLEERLIEECGQDISSGGRKPSFFDICKNRAFLLGIEMTRLTAGVVLANLKMQIMEERILERTPNLDWSGMKVLDIIFRYVAEILEKRNLSMQDILCIGVGVSGSIDHKTGLIAEINGKATLDWMGLNIRGEIQKKLGRPVYADLGANAVAVGEYLYGAGQECNSLAVLGYASSLNSALISNGKLVRSETNCENTFAHTIINLSGKKCVCGNRGCLQMYAAIPVVVQEVLKRIALGEECNLEIGNFDMDTYRYRAIAKAAYEGDRVCTEEIRNAAYFFGVGAANYISMLNPELVILAGPFARYDDLYYNIAVQTAKEILKRKGIVKTKFQKGTFLGRGRSSLSISAAAMAFECYMKNNVVSW